jgi:hypothetical protein
LLAWSLAGAAVALHLAGHAFVVLGIGTGTPGDRDMNLGAAGFLVAFYAFPLVGAVIATRRPDHAIGWLFLGGGLAFALSDLASSYADYALYADPGRLPAGEWAGWTVLWSDPLFFCFVILLVLLFPEGRLPSPRWRPVLVALVAASVGLMVGAAIRPGPIFAESLPVENPAGLPGADSVRSVVEAVGSVLFLLTAILACVGTVLRFRRARGVERQQFKWFALAVGFLFSTLLMIGLTSIGFPEQLAEALIGVGIAGIAVSVGIAVLRYRLYDIDRVVSKALVYGALTLVLGAGYAGLVLVGQALFSSVAGGSDLAIAVSTLVVAALFLPVRSRVQRLVDRRFYRRRYDAERTLGSFGARLRDHVELEGLRSDLEDVVRETMEPAHVSVWLREAHR